MNRNLVFGVITLVSLGIVSPAAALVRHAGSNFKWPAHGSSLNVIKGRIDRWSGKGVLEAGGFLGLGNTHLDVIPQTVIVDSVGKRLTQHALRPGLNIASIYTVRKMSNKASAVMTAGENKVALVIVLETP